MPQPPSGSSEAQRGHAGQAIRFEQAPFVTYRRILEHLKHGPVSVPGGRLIIDREQHKAGHQLRVANLRLRSLVDLQDLDLADTPLSDLALQSLDSLQQEKDPPSRQTPCAAPWA